MEEAELKQVLKECKKSARLGYKIAVTQEKTLDRSLSTAQETVQNTIFDFNNSPCYAPETTELLEGQLTEIRTDFDRLSFAFKEDLQNLKEKLSVFSITVFGRTMAGKSTLMEILTEGDGSSIGKGSQRTTQDIRRYYWNDLEITDVPGIGAFEGEEDEQIAFEAAKTADLVIFIITDDAPQYTDAEWLSRIVELGKPVICIMNIKTSINNSKSAKYNIKKINSCFNKERLDSIHDQFLAFSEQFGQNWKHIPFVYVHLESAFVAQSSKDIEIRKGYYDVSRIEYLESRIIGQIKSKGSFYRIKTFVDIISNPILHTIENLLEQSQVNSVQGRTILAKRKQLSEWKDVFYRDEKGEIKSLIVRIKSELNGEIASFAEEHFDDKNADKAWNELLQSRKIELRCQDLLNDIEARSNDKLKEISREITNELKFATSFEGDKSLRMHAIIDGKRIWDWGSIAISGGLTIASGIAYLLGATIAGPLGWSALAVSAIGVIGSFLFKSREKKEYEARTALEKQLRENVNKICDTLERHMEKNLDTLISVRIIGLIAEMDKIIAVIFKLADTQKNLAWGLNNNLLELNAKIVSEAIHKINADESQYLVQSVARIPGNIDLLLLEDKTFFPEEHKEKLQRLMDERINFVYNTNNKRILISMILGSNVDRNLISIEDKIGVAHVPVECVTPDLQNRVRLAQQLSCLLIMNQ